MGFVLAGDAVSCMGIPADWLTPSDEPPTMRGQMNWRQTRAAIVYDDWRGDTRPDA
jgi:hypothetical protein